MNTETGQVYEGLQILTAIDRGEPIVAVSSHVARAMKIGNHMLQKGRAQATRKRKRVQSKKDRKRGRS